MPKRLCVLAFAICALCSACKSGDTDARRSSNAAATTTPSPAPSSSSVPVMAQIDACQLLTNDDLKAVQGETPTQALRSDRAEGGFVVVQCYYSLPTTSNSVVLNVTTAAKGGRQSPREFWNQTFANKEEKDKDRNREAKERKGEAEEEGAKPEKISGVGEDAYWVASRVGGALYVLKNAVFFRISVGGAGDANTKLNKSKALARRAVTRL